MSAVVSLSRHTLRQLKFIVPGGIVTFWLRSHEAFWAIVNGDATSGGWAWSVSLLSCSACFPMTPSCA